MSNTVCVQGKPRVLNARRSLPDARVGFFPRRAALVHVGHADISANGPAIYDQGKRSSCTTNGWGRCFEYIEIIDRKAKLPADADPFQFPEEGDQLVRPSRRFMYRMEGVEEGDPGQDNGAQIVTGGIVLAKYGVCPEKVWPYDVSDEEFLIAPPQAVMDEASKHLGKTSYKLMDTAHIKETIIAGFPVVCGISLYSSFMSDEVARTGHAPMPVSGDTYEGGHCVVIVGFDDRTRKFKFANSWGTEWGEKGYFYLDYDYVNNPNLFFDPMTLRPTPK